MTSCFAYCLLFDLIFAVLLCFYWLLRLFLLAVLTVVCLMFGWYLLRLFVFVVVIKVCSIIGVYVCFAGLVFLGFVLVVLVVLFSLLLGVWLPAFAVVYGTYDF